MFGFNKSSFFRFLHSETFLHDVAKLRSLALRCTMAGISTAAKYWSEKLGEKKVFYVQAAMNALGADFPNFAEKIISEYAAGQSEKSSLGGHFMHRLKMIPRDDSNLYQIIYEASGDKERERLRNKERAKIRNIKSRVNKRVKI